MGVVGYFAYVFFGTGTNPVRASSVFLAGEGQNEAATAFTHCFSLGRLWVSMTALIRCDQDALSWLTPKTNLVLSHSRDEEAL